MRETLLRAAAPIASVVADLGVTVGSTRLQRRRRGGEYATFKTMYRQWRRGSRAEMLEVQQTRLAELVAHARSHSPFYHRRLDGLSATDLSRFPILEKSDLQEHIGEIVIGDRNRLDKSFTGGTTGKALTVYNARESFEERFAILDLFWEAHEFELGREPIAWLSGRSLLWPTDDASRRYWRNNWLYKVRYYSTFHMSADRMLEYVKDLNRFRPRFMHGFPSAISEIARFVRATGASLTFQPKAIFSTSETLNDEQRGLIESVFGSHVRNHYSASEGAPFILECPAGSLHFDVTTGIIEVIDDDGRPATEGEMLVTCFFTRNTPIIRYRIGDRVSLAPEARRCSCGWDTPLVEAIHGRRMDYVEIPGRGRMFNSQIGDCVKDVTTVRKFQVEMREGRLQVYMVADPAAFESQDKAKFLKKLRERIGETPIDLLYVPDLPRTASGKFSMVRNPSR